MRLGPYGKGSASPAVGALTADTVLDLGALAARAARAVRDDARADRRGRRCALPRARGARTRARGMEARGRRRPRRREARGARGEDPSRGADSAAAAQRLLPRAELYGARRRARRRGARPSRVLHEGAGVRAGPRREDRPPSGDAGAGLRGRAGGRHWRGPPRHPARGGPRAPLRLHARPRRDGARPPETPRSVVQGQVARRPRQPGHRALISQPSKSSTVTVRSAKATGATRCPRSNVTTCWYASAVGTR